MDRAHISHFAGGPAGDDGQQGEPPKRRQTPEPEPEREPGREALGALRGAESDALIAVMLRPSFKRIGEDDLVVVAPCPHCGDGGLRTAGSVKTRTGREQVRGCDTCRTVEIGPLGRAQVVRLPDTKRWA
jgi:hypothetical protein